MVSTEYKTEEHRSKYQQQNGFNSQMEDLPLENFDEENDETLEVEMVVPPDGGWGWVIVVASFMCNFIVDGIICTFGDIQEQMRIEFKTSASRVSFIGSLQTGFYLMAGPFVSALANRYGFRLVAISGSLLSFISFILSSYCSSSVEFLYVSYGVLGGIGMGMIYVPSVITTGFYFEKWRALATSIAVCGSGIGASVLSPVTTELLKHFDWKKILTIQSGMLLACGVFGMMFRPLKPSRIKMKKSTDPENPTVDIQNSLTKTGSISSLHCEKPVRSHGFFGTNNNMEYPTAAELIGSSPNIVNITKSLHSLHFKEVVGSVLHRDMKKSNSEKRLSVPIYPELEILDQHQTTIDEENNLLDGDVERLNGKIPTIRRHTISGRRFRANSDCSQKSIYAIRGRRHTQAPRDHQRPFYRDDIFYGGSLSRLPHYKSQLSSVGYHMSVTRLPTMTDVAEEESGSCYLCPESVRRILTTMLDLSLLKSPSFLILAISGGLTMMGFYTPFTYLKGKAQHGGMENNTVGYLISAIGVSNTFGRLVCGAVSSIPGVDTLMLNNIFISIAGLVTILSSVSDSKSYQFFYASSFGLSISVFAALRSILVVELLGLEKLTNAFGLTLLFQGVAAALGVPLSSLIFDSTQDYKAPFYLSGALILLSAVICYPLKRINEWEKNQEKDDSETSIS